jgi:hypothetical protein
MSSTVVAGGFEITSNTESAAEMKEALASSQKDDSADEPRIVSDRGEDVEDKPKSGLSKAASELGKKGGEAAAKARKDTPAPKAKAEAEPAAKDAKAKPEGDEKAPRKGEGDPRLDPKARVTEATRELAEERRQRAAERQQYEERLARLEDVVRRATTPRQPEPEAGQPQREAQRRPVVDDPNDPEPKEADFDDYAEYVKAAARHAARQEHRQVQQQAQIRHHAKTYADRVVQHVDQFNERMTQAREADPEVMSRVDPRLLQLRPTFALERGARVTPLNVVADEIMASEHGLAVMLHITENPDDMRRLLAQPNRAAIAREFARLEARAAGAAPEPKAEPSRARPPMKPVSGSAHAADPDVHGEMDFDTFVSRRKSGRSR